MDAPGLSLIISFYNKLDNLRLILASLELQSFSDFEVIIADDGSSGKVTAELEDIIQSNKINIRHVWHEDDGWRKNIILNKAIVASRSDYLVFIDGDCILHQRCLEEHYSHRMEKWIIAGRRVNLSPRLSDEITPSKITKGRLWGSYMLRMAWDSLRNKNIHSENAIYLRSPFLRSRINRKDKGVLGSHFSLYKKDIMEVNGFDERFLHPAVGEDTDLEFRLRRNGMKVQTLKHIAIQYHLYHAILPREESNLRIMEENNMQEVTYTPYGIRK
ncbi:MAG TPA: glycosyltransferase [Bacteroides sp.]|nr:glycosyltransferase [Bacteroides sp.]